MIGLLCCIVRLKLVIHSVHLAPAIILSEVLGIPPTHPAKSFITNSAIGLWQILPKHTKSIFFIALALLRYFFQYSRKSLVRREALKCILLRMAPVATQYTKKAIRRYEKGESIQSLCQELHISQSTLYHWRREYCSIQTATHTYTPKEFDSITRRLQKAEHKLEIIQLSGYLSKVPLQDRIATLEHLHTEFTKVYSVHELCEALDVARGTFYNHIFRRADRSKYESEQAQLALKVKQIFDDSEQRYGAEKIRTILISNGLHVSKKHISAIMQELGLHSVRTDATVWCQTILFRNCPSS